MQKLQKKGKNVKIVTTEEEQHQIELAKKYEALQKQILDGGHLLADKEKEAAAEKRAL
jgi:hypothetical protein